MEWQPIETAPMDGTDVLLLRRFPFHHQATPVVAGYFGGGWCSYDEPNKYISGEITHWMPLPEPPQ